MITHQITEKKLPKKDCCDTVYITVTVTNVIVTALYTVFFFFLHYFGSKRRILGLLSFEKQDIQ